MSLSSLHAAYKSYGFINVPLMTTVTLEIKYDQMSPMKASDEIFRMI